MLVKKKKTFSRTTSCVCASTTEVLLVNPEGRHSAPGAFCAKPITRVTEHTHTHTQYVRVIEVSFSVS